MSYVRPDESARLSYDMVKNGQFEKAIQQAAWPAAAADDARPGQTDPGRQAAGFLGLRQVSVAGRQLSVMDDDGFTMTGFTLRRPTRDRGARSDDLCMPWTAKLPGGEHGIPMLAARSPSRERANA